MNANMKTHKNEDPISIFLPALDHLVVLFLCSFGIYGEKRTRAVTETGCSLRWCRLSLVVIYFLYTRELGRDGSKKQVIPALFPLSGSP